MNNNFHTPILVHSHLRWDFVWQRPQQIFSRLAQHHPILFLEDPIEGQGLRRLEITVVQSNVVRVVPVLPKLACTMSVDEQSLSTLALLKHALLEHPLLKNTYANPIQWFYSPMSAKVFMNKFQASAVVYDCMDELANFKFAPADLSLREDALLAYSNIVFTGGHQLFKAKSQRHSNVHFFGCGVDVDHFGKARAAATPVCLDIAKLPRPVIGYFGVIDERLDYELIASLAEKFPTASVVMVGPFAKVNPEELPKRPNIHWLGQRAYKDLPNIVKGFDVCIMPFALNAATQYINPTKTLEYMAAGKPVVSTAIQDVVHHFTPVVKVAYSHDEFADAVQQALRQPQAELLAQGLAHAAKSTWDVTVGHMRALVLQAAAFPLKKPKLVNISNAVKQLPRLIQQNSQTQQTKQAANKPSLQVVRGKL
ncbi:MAG: glycosyltransferase [Limnobacter sp.]|nr:glycosyltransferase [Limnobacter sp.]